MTYPPVVVVDEDDTVVGEAMLADARVKGLIYRTVFVIGRGPDGRILLQKRSPKMQLYPGCWDISAGGHVDGGHEYDEAARLELLEEIGVEHVSLHELTRFFTEEPLWGDIAAKRFVKIYETTIDTLPRQLGEDEVMSVRWFTPDEIDGLVASHPETIAEGLRHSLPYIVGDS